MSNQECDIAIFGGGVAGLWSLARLRAAGYSTVLFEQRALGGVQSVASQGIIHGGSKYALTGKLTHSAQAIGEMPNIWRACLQGEGEIDLRDVQVASQHQYLWTSASLASNMAGFFASKVMRSRMQKLPQTDYPELFAQPAFKGDLYRLDEPVLNTASLVSVLAEQGKDHCYQMPAMPGFRHIEKGWEIMLPQGEVVQTGTILLSAGRGNAALLECLQLNQPAMQTRPLHMLMLKGDLPMLYAHCLGAGALPRLTITSDRLPDGQVVWYLGGKVAEDGVKRTREAQIAAGKAELAEVLPWVDTQKMAWSALTIERAEPDMLGGKRPDDSFVDAQNDVITAWPTKLAFAPRLASQVLAQLLEQRPPAGTTSVVQLNLPHPPVAQQPWYAEDIWY